MPGAAALLLARTTPATACTIAALRPRVLAVVVTLVILGGGAVAAVALRGDDEEPAASLEEVVEDQLRYLSPRSSALVAVDLRYREENWRHLDKLASRLLREYGATQGVDRDEIPRDLRTALRQLVSSAGLSFGDDVEPLLDGYLTLGVTVRPRRPLPARLVRLGELLEGGASFDAARGGYVRFPRPDPSRAGPGSRPPAIPRPRLIREADGTRVTRLEGQRYFEAVARRRDARPRIVAAYRTPGGDLERVVEKALDRSGEEDEPRKLEGYDKEVRLLGESIALVGDDTVVLTQGGEGGGVLPGARAGPLRAALDRAESGRGYPVSRLASARRQTGVDDPLVLATGDLSLARVVAQEPSLRRARREVAYLGAVRAIAAAVDIDSQRATGVLRVATEAARLREADLPVPPAGDLELPDTRLVAGASRDQSVTTTFAARVVRALFADSRFVRAVDRVERDLGIRFEDEVLRQFNCPSISVFDTPAQRFAARSCVRDPERMRRLLPRLVPHLPRLLTALQGLGDEGMLALLLVAPDAPLTPSLPLAAIEVRPATRRPGRAGERLYEISGLQDDVRNPLAQAGPERVVFGMIGERFVVASDREMARRVARMPTRRAEARAASAIRVPGPQLLASRPDDEPEIRSVARLLEELLVTVSATRSELTARGSLRFGR